MLERNIITDKILVELEIKGPIELKGSTVDLWLTFEQTLWKQNSME
jgi:hypothetical protein